MGPFPEIPFVLVFVFFFSLSSTYLPTAAGQTDPCAAHGRCSECVFDASDGILSPVLDCAWCPTTHQCMTFSTSLLPQNESAEGEDTNDGENALMEVRGAWRVRANVASLNLRAMCPDLRHLKHNPTCPDMSCSAAQTTNNIYICRPTAILALIFTILLMLFNMCFYFWLSTVRQLPWKYEPWLSKIRAGEPLDEVLAMPRADTVVITNVDEPITSSSSPSNAKRSEPGSSNKAGTGKKQQKQQQQEQQSAARVPTNCPICKMAQPLPLGPGCVCFWCDIARFGFLAFYIGLSSSILCFILIFSVSLKPWFADGYFAYLIVSAYVAYALFILYVFYFRKNNVHVEEARSTLYLELTIYLHGRSLLNVMPTLGKAAKRIEDEALSAFSPTFSHVPPLSHAQNMVGETTSSTGGILGMTHKLTPSEALQKKGETAQILSSDFLDHHFRRVLKQTIARDELVLWCEKPDVSSIISHDLWLVIDLTVGVLLGIWMLVSSTIKDTSYVLISLFGDTSIGVIGVVCILAFALLLMTTINSCTRVYILTDRRLMTIYNGVISPIVAETDLQSVRFASVYGYNDWSAEPLLTFSWEVPITERKLPPIKSHNFPGVENLKEFLKYFSAVAPNVQTKHEQSREGMRHDRQVWRMHLFLCFLFLELLPIITLYPLVVPGFLSFLLFLLIGAVALATVHRGIRVQQLTFAQLGLASCWAENRQSDMKGSMAFSSTNASISPQKGKASSVANSAIRSARRATAPRE